jgi:Cu/Ag efflux protein CusF
MKMRNLITTVAAALLPFAAIAQQPDVTGIELVGPGKYAGAFEEMALATVESIDNASRSLVLKRSSGENLIVVAGSEVRNFEQIKVGDKVVSRHLIALEMTLKKGSGSIRERAESTDSGRAKPGEKPGAYEVKRVAFVANVQEVSAKKQTVTLLGATKTIQLRVKNPAQLKLIKKGDQVEGVFLEAVAIEVIAAPAR